LLNNIKGIMNRNVQIISPWVSIATAVEIMKQSRASGLPVVEEGSLKGILTSRDVREAHPNRLVADAMTHNPVAVTPQISLWHAKELLEEHQIERLIVIEDGRLVGIITATQIYAELGKHIDPLTGLPRAEYLYQKAIELLLQNNQEIIIIFIDMNDFGNIDKDFGHVVGDQVLRQVGDELQKCLPDNCFLCRYAGDEFALVLSAPQKDAIDLAYLLVSRIAQLEFEQDFSISASAGVAGGRRFNQRLQREENSTVSDLINMASLASTRAKREKCQVIVAEGLQLIEVS